MKNRVITISREFGSGGHTIGKMVAEKLGIPCYDAEIIQEMAKETGFSPDYVKEAGEYAPGSFLFAAFSNRMFGPTNEDILWERQYRVITELAEKGPCVIIGRCADVILTNNHIPHISIFITAPFERRVQHIMELHKDYNKKKAQKMLKQLDRQHQDYYNFYTGRRWGNADNYDLCMNSAAYGITGSVDLILRMLTRAEE